MAAEAPPWLLTMRAITGLKEEPGEKDNPQILAMATSIAQHFPEMKSYCAQYNHDSIAWCGLAAAYTLAQANIRPPFGKTDTDKFLWAQSFADDPGFARLQSPKLGCIVVGTREGGGHVTLYESASGSNYMCRGGNQSDSVNLAPFPKSSVIALLWPNAAGPLPPNQRRVVMHGDTGQDVAEIQRILELPVDGEFGPLTEAGVTSFQAAAGLTADGEVGANTWAALDDLDKRRKAGTDGLPPEVIGRVESIAQASPLMTYNWRDRGVAPAGYIPGIALTFALAVDRFNKGEADAAAMAQADRNDPATDVLSWYKSEMQAKGWQNNVAGLDTLRHLFVLILGLGMRESSGRYCEGRDMSASNTSSDTCEAGLLQTSWNIRSADPQIQPLLDAYWLDPNGFVDTFQAGVTPKADEVASYGTGGGARYQFLAKYSPAFAVAVTAIALRKRRQHWGPVNNKAVELLDEADAMFKEVQAAIEVTPPEPEPVEHPTVNMTVEAGVRIIINGTVVVE